MARVGYTPPGSGGGGASLADITAAVTPLTPVLCNLALATSAVDGTATSFEVVLPKPSATASGVVPAGWISVFSVPDVATLEGLLGSQSITTATVLVVSEPGIYQFAATAIDEPWTDITPDDGVPVYPGPAAGECPSWFKNGELLYMSADRVFAVNPSGLDSGLTTVDAVLENHESIVDTERTVCAYFDTTVIDPTDYDTAPVTQPTPDGGVIALGGDVFVLTAVDTTARGIWHIDADDGTWSFLDYPDILIGNSFMVQVNAEGDAADLEHFEWIDDDPTIPQRRSNAYPGSSNGFGDGRNGRWGKFAGPTAVI